MRISDWSSDVCSSELVARSAIAAVRSLVPDFGTGVDAVFDDDLVARRGAYYLGVNNVFGLIGALGAAGIAPEARLLGTTRAVLHRLPRPRSTEERSEGTEGGSPGRSQWSPIT